MSGLELFIGRDCTAIVVDYLVETRSEVSERFDSVLADLETRLDRSGQCVKCGKVPVGGLCCLAEIQHDTYKLDEFMRACIDVLDGKRQSPSLCDIEERLARMVRRSKINAIRLDRMQQRT